MPVNQALATYSDWTYAAAVVVYVVAAVLYLCEQAFSRAKAPRREAVAAGVGAGVGAGAGGDVRVAGTGADGTWTPGRVVAAPRPSRAERLGRMGLALNVLGALLHLASLVLRGLSTGRAPWGNMYEYGSLLTLAAVVTWLILVRSLPVRRLGGFVLVPVVVLMFMGGTVLYADAGPVTPPLQSYWLAIHVSIIAVGSGVLLVPGVASVLYLLKSSGRARFTRLPDADALDRVAYRSTVFAFPLFTIGIICGAIWAEAAWGRFWGWDPKETVAFVSWVVYAAYLHARATAGWRGRPAAWINTLGFALTVFNLFFINLVTTGLHSYAGVS
ncbi:c-type cytochrome biogenesis protein CcsB [Saccharothrix coeruleofusca]|uniref:C-type cytochrome biogenesis protein CcsB n=1 Tax=Saccharothrix coeruleofusca TaxID=33919 RepID=A0A918AMC8_9PSEU|nr:c-type cytochrome biogenesis protein CcsB [Saccharothrix coeruleofusca]GGP57163.1 c-type cytochrome biogenesis protein CcsB [Saccharothrix coeruleofusca]